MGKKSNNILNKAVNSGFFRYALQQAAHILADYKNSQSLIDDVKFHLTDKKGKINEIKQEVLLLVEMVAAYAKGEYRDIPWSSIVMIVAGLIYFVSPIDVIPDFFPVAGLVDDISVILWVYHSLRHEIERYKDWKRNQKTTILEREE
ncbi:YkvA family protein [Persicobacter psychrovividus]|uniref:DUF1232 domain-containing protein n=1 Tax=Persicobacter psychrovividus TaxID=387638 RepID=A0ABN6L5I1_9BACT|nr:hypothetical protein PEPS_06190 [Persicobacter psychrovividus]